MKFSPNLHKIPNFAIAYDVGDVWGIGSSSEGEHLVIPLLWPEKHKSTHYTSPASLLQECHIATKLFYIFSAKSKIFALCLSCVKHEDLFCNLALLYI